MPYIKQEDRHVFDTEIHLLAEKIKTPGELNYCISKLLVLRAEELGFSYTTFNELIGVMDCASKEFYRRFVALYEMKKEAENGGLD